MDVALFDYELPPELIAQEPAEPRDSSRLLVVDRARGTWVDRRFSDLPAFLREGDCLVANQSRVIPARLLGTLEPGGHPVELLLLRPVDGERWEALVRPGRRCRAGARVSVAAGAARVRIVAEKEDGVREVDGRGALARARDCSTATGCRPCPRTSPDTTRPSPTIASGTRRCTRGTTGAVAAPTAGLHFTPELLGALGATASRSTSSRCTSGVGTFRPVRAERVEEHRMAAEHVEISARRRPRRSIGPAAEGRRIVAVGTTTVRALEWAARRTAGVRPAAGPTDLFITPAIASARSTRSSRTSTSRARRCSLLVAGLLPGASALLGAYAHAVAARYRFYSYGDAMLDRVTSVRMRAVELRVVRTDRRRARRAGCAPPHGDGRDAGLHAGRRRWGR